MDVDNQSNAACLPRFYAVNSPKGRAPLACCTKAFILPPHDTAHAFVGSQVRYMSRWWPLACTKTRMHACSSLLLFLPMEALELSLAFSSFLCCDFLLLLSLQDIIQVHGMPQKPPAAF